MRNKLISAFIISHILFAIFLGRMYAFAPDEAGYLSAFNNVYSWPVSNFAQSGSGWITAPTLFLWIAYLPAKFLNLIGVSDILSIRLLSVMLTGVSLFLLLEMQKGLRVSRRIPQQVIFLSFFIPSIFLWTTVGLRESFIIAELTAFLAGLNLLYRGRKMRASILMFLGSYGLISTKNYLWVCLMMAVIIAVVIQLARKTNYREVLRIITIGFVAPLILFASTTSVYALNYMFSSGTVSVTDSTQRSGDSATQIYVETPNSGMSIDDIPGENSGKQLVTFHGDYTLIALHFYLIDNPNSWFSKTARVFSLDDKIKRLFNEKLQAGLIRKDKSVGTDTSSLNGHILKPGRIDNPISMLWPAVVFLAGPFPFIGNPGIAASISSLESPLWWLLYALVFLQFYRYRGLKSLRDPVILFTLIFLCGEIALSSLIQVNLGTSFRHRSIILVPLIFIYLRIAQKAKEIDDKALDGGSTSSGG